MNYVRVSMVLLVILAIVECFPDAIQTEMDEGQCQVQGKYGNCKRVDECKFIRELLIKQNRDNISEKIKAIACGFDGKTQMVCCPPEKTQNESPILFNDKTEVVRNRPKTTTPKLPVQANKHETYPTEKRTTNEAQYVTNMPTVGVAYNPLPNNTVCGQVNSDRIIGGTIAGVDEFPWMARIKYIAGSVVSYNCAASLITERYLVSAAHCFINRSNKKIPVAVRLGEWNVDSDECFQDMCPVPVEIPIGRVIVHPHFSQENYTYADIAIVELAEPVTYTDFIQPICLPTSEYVAMQDIRREAPYTASGWGITEFGTSSVVKRKVSLDSVKIDNCQAALPKIPDSSAPYLICAGGKRGFDTCSGDSGGPLMREVMENYYMNWYLYGITSFGARQCGSEGVPSVYTRVTKYMEWIESNIS